MSNTAPRGAGLDVLFIGTLPPHPGGSAIANGALLACCAALGHSVRALAPTTPQGLAAGDGFAATHPRIDVSRYLVDAFDVAPAASADETAHEREEELIREHLPQLLDRRPDVVILGRENYAHRLPDLVRAHALRSVLMVHGTGIRPVLDGTAPPEGARRLLQEFRKVDRVVTSGRDVAASLARLGVSGVTVIRNGVDLRRFAPAPPDPALRRVLGVGPDDVVVLHASNLKPLKRPVDLARSAALALREEPRLLYVVVGDGPCRQHLETACAELGVAGRFRFTGWVPHDQMPAYLNLADVVAMPSQAETQALVYLEAQACGRVLLASDIPAAREVVRDGWSGLLFRVGDVEDFAARTLLAARDPAWRGAIGRAARLRVQGHSLEHVGAEYAAMLEEVAVGVAYGAAGPAPERLVAQDGGIGG